jgi:DnaJ-class molecular chaperone
MNGTFEKNHYEVLEVQTSASSAEIKEAYRILASVWHPDRFQPGTKQHERATERLKEINAAYEVLKDADKRAAYDRLLEQQSERGNARTPTAAADFTSEQVRLIERNRRRYEQALSSRTMRKFCEALDLHDVRDKAITDLKAYRVELAQELLARFLKAEKM